MQRETAPELEFAVDLIGLASQARLQLHALPHHPLCRFETAAHQDFREIGIGPVLGQSKQVVEKLLLRVGSEVDVDEIFLRQRRQHGDEIVDAAEREAERAAGEMRVAAALLKGSRFEHQHVRAVLLRRDRGAQGGIARPDHEHVRRLAGPFGGIHGFPATARLYFRTV